MTARRYIQVDAQSGVHGEAVYATTPAPILGTHWEIYWIPLAAHGSSPATITLLSVGPDGGGSGFIATVRLEDAGSSYEVVVEVDGVEYLRGGALTWAAKQNVSAATIEAGTAGIKFYVNVYGGSVTVSGALTGDAAIYGGSWASAMSGAQMLLGAGHSAVSGTENPCAGWISAPYPVAGDPPEPSYPLNQLSSTTNLVAAYSVARLLTASYSGDCIIVRRASDNATQAIGFTAAGALDEAAIAAHCGASNGFVTTLYDQSGNGDDLTQTTAAYQPKIYDGGTGLVVKIGSQSRPAAYFDGANDRMDRADAHGLTGNPGQDIFQVLRADGASANLYSWYTGGDPSSNGFVLTEMASATTIGVRTNGAVRTMTGSEDLTTASRTVHLRRASGGQIGAAAVNVDGSDWTEDSSSNPTTTPSLADELTQVSGYSTANFLEMYNSEMVYFAVGSGNALSSADAAILRANQLAFYG